MFTLYDGYTSEPPSSGTLGTPLPSGTSADRVVAGDPKAIPALLLHWGVRTGLIAGGLYVAGHGGKNLLLHAFGASTAIELFVIGWAAMHRDEPA